MNWCSAVKLRVSLQTSESDARPLTCPARFSGSVTRAFQDSSCKLTIAMIFALISGGSVMKHAGWVATASGAGCDISFEFD